MKQSQQVCFPMLLSTRPEGINVRRWRETSVSQPRVCGVQRHLRDLGGCSFCYVSAKWRRPLSFMSQQPLRCCGAQAASQDPTGPAGYPPSRAHGSRERCPSRTPGRLARRTHPVGCFLKCVRGTWLPARTIQSASRSSTQPRAGRVLLQEVHHGGVVA